ncbi:opioid-binding protein/cell adhesion molecule homolog [Phlebotomus argentipes]|uniref:opioid-binding protein/cell adhesion molecule homolog n=1 Tax=Phlebotomus argentipes TaxID=94469 RepID=UPI0028935E97|nr:opioid-binding protein/cell adhesion molecule homolog [Phlebotomus argentipes]
MSGVFVTFIHGFIASLMIISTGVLGHKAMDFSSVPTTVKTVENDTVLLPCSHNGPYGYVRWLREEALLADSGNPSFTPPERVTLFANGSLQVASVKLEDTGEYLCQIASDSGLAMQRHAIEVQYPPSVISHPSGEVTMKVGALFEIVCEARGVPFPIISWRRPGENASDPDHVENRRRLLVEVRSRHDAGVIECVADNGFGSPAVAGVLLVAQFVPEVKAETSVVHTKIGFRATLECTVTAEPSAVVHWFHHTAPVTDNKKIVRQDTLESSRSHSQLYTVSRHLLIVKNVQDMDLGMYECKAENKVGVKSAIIELTGRPMPSVFKQSPVAASPMTHSLIWQTESLSPLAEYKLRFRQVPTGNVTPHSRLPPRDWTELTIPGQYSDGPIHTSSYELRGLSPASVYEVVVAARNRYGWSDASKVMRFATAGEIEEATNVSTESVDYNQIDDNFIPDMNSSGNYDYSTSGSELQKVTVTVFVTCFLFQWKGMQMTTNDN